MLVIGATAAAVASMAVAAGSYDVRKQQLKVVLSVSSTSSEYFQTEHTFCFGRLCSSSTIRASMPFRLLTGDQQSAGVQTAAEDLLSVLAVCCTTPLRMPQFMPCLQWSNTDCGASKKSGGGGATSDLLSLASLSG